MSISDRLDQIERDANGAAWPLVLGDDVPALLAALRAVLDLHKAVEVPVISGACAAEECDHEDACPTHPLSVCGGCMDRAEEINPYATENSEAMARLVYPCDDVRAVTAALGEGS